MQDVFRPCRQQAVRLGHVVVVHDVDEFPAVGPAKDAAGRQDPWCTVRRGGEGDRACWTAWLELPLAIGEGPHSIGPSSQRFRPLGGGQECLHLGGSGLLVPSIAVQARDAAATGCEYNPIARDCNRPDVVSRQAVRRRVEVADELAVAARGKRSGSRRVLCAPNERRGDRQRQQRREAPQMQKSNSR